MHVKIITPRKIVVDQEAKEVMVPSAEGYLTVLPKHIHLLTLLKEGIIMMKGSGEEFLAIGGGYMETDGSEVNILVSRAYKQDELDEELTEKAIAEAKRLLEDVKDEKQRHEIEATLRRSAIDMKLIKRRKSK
jgi:F-type H+-transporting ATPase subunit epsilon